MSEGNSPSSSKEGYFGPVRRRYEPTRTDAGVVLQKSGIPQESSAFRRARGLFARKIFRKEQEGDTDPATGIANRRGLQKMLATELPLAKRLGVPSIDIEIDLDGLKALNDREGHKAGDKLIQDFVTRVRECIRGSDAFARTGGDEFRLVLFGTDLENAQNVWNKIKTNLGPINASAGAALIDYEDFDGSVKKADEAMYSAKRGYQTTGISELGLAT